MPVSSPQHCLIIWVSDGSRKVVPYHRSRDRSDLWGSPLATPSASGAVSLLETRKELWTYMEGKERLGSSACFWQGITGWSRRLHSSNTSEHPRAPELHTCFKIHLCFPFSWPNPAFPNRSGITCPLKLGWATFSEPLESAKPG